jgi:hypothetical protein
MPNVSELVKYCHGCKHFLLSELCNSNKTSKGEKSVNLKNLWGYFVLMGR